MAKKKEEIPSCSFCGRPATIADLIPSGDSTSYICVDCIDNMYHTLEQMNIILPSKQKGSRQKAEKKALSSPVFENVPSPRQIKEFLDQYVVGQDDAKKYLSVAV